MDECPIRNIISRFSGKWPVIILCILSENECTRFNQIQKAIPDISPKVLSDTLKNLETDGIIKRIVYGEVPPRVEYSLTKLGLSLMPYINNSILLILKKTIQKVTSLQLSNLLFYMYLHINFALSKR